MYLSVFTCITRMYSNTYKSIANTTQIRSIPCIPHVCSPDTCVATQYTSPIRREYVYYPMQTGRGADTRRIRSKYASVRVLAPVHPGHVKRESDTSRIRWNTCSDAVLGRCCLPVVVNYLPWRPSSRRRSSSSSLESGSRVGARVRAGSGCSLLPPEDLAARLPMATSW